MAAITASLNGTALPPIEKDFIRTSGENAADVEVLSGDVYTDFISQIHTWTFNYDSLTEDEYDTIRAAYDAQFIDFDYPLLSIPYYSVSNQPVRMYINEKNIWNNCGAIQGVQIKFRQTSQLPEVS